MNLKIEPTWRVIYPNDKPVTVLVVGMGGTGSALGMLLAGILYHAKQKGIEVSAVFCDHDKVELKNCGRQFFSPADVDRNKAQVIAEWLNHDWGLDIKALPERFTSSLVNYPPHCLNLMVGCVDNHQARQEMAAFTEKADGKVWWLDCGNDRQNGQVLFGNVPAEAMKLSPALGLAHSLPHPAAQMPELVREPEGLDNALLSCAELTALEEQGLNINKAMAVCAAQYLHNVIFKRELDIFTSYVGLEPPTTRSLFINQSNLASWLPADNGEITPQMEGAT